jgi:hypothetical protein
VLAVMANQVARHGSCTLAVGHLAALAGTCATVVRRALRAAAAAGLLTIEERRARAWRNDTNLVTITSAAWLSWLRLSTLRGEGALSRGPRDSYVSVESHADLRSDHGHFHKRGACEETGRASKAIGQPPAGIRPCQVGL